MTHPPLTSVAFRRPRFVAFRGIAERTRPDFRDALESNAYSYTLYWKSSSDSHFPSFRSAERKCGLDEAKSICLSSVARVAPVRFARPDLKRSMMCCWADQTSRGNKTFAERTFVTSPTLRPICIGAAGLSCPFDVQARNFSAYSYRPFRRPLCNFLVERLLMAISYSVTVSVAAPMPAVVSNLRPAPL